MEILEVADPTLLTYIPTTDPAPLQTSPAHGKIIITIPIPKTPVYCNKIVLGVPYGTDEGSLTVNPLDTSNIGVNPSAKWQVGLGNAKDLDLPADVTAFVLSTIGSGNELINYGITITIDDFVVNEVPGDFLIQLIENSGTDGVKYSQKNSFIKLRKTDYDQFYVKNFRATRPDGSGIAVAEANYNTAVILNWEGSDNQYTLTYNQNTPIPLQGNTSWQSPPLKEDTVFILQATQQSALAKDALGDPQTLYLYQSIVVKVATPDVVFNSATVNHDLQVKGVISGIGIVPPGGIIMYSGDLKGFDSNGTGLAGTMYQGWQICNKYNGTPDLRDRFIVGAGGAYTIGATGGAASVTLTKDQMPTHNHGGATGGTAPFLNYCGVYYNSQGVSKGLMYNNGIADPNGNRPNLLTTRGLPEVQVQNHGHVIGIDGGGQAHENRPPYYALAFIMKLH
jgi:microcystin-dependent protein